MIKQILSLAKELNLPPEVLPPLEAAAEALPQGLPVPALASPETAASAWAEVTENLPLWEADGGFAQLAAVLAAACTTRENYRQAGVADEIFLSTMACLPRFLGETKDLFGHYAFDRGFWTWRQTGCLLFRLGALEFEYALAEISIPGLGFHVPALHVHIPSNAPLSREALEDSYAQAKRFFTREGAAFCKHGPPLAMLCSSWLLAPALDGLLPEESGIRRFVGDYDRLLVREDNTEFYRWLFRKTAPAPLEDLPETTSLQRTVKAHLAAGGKVGSAVGRLRGGF